MRLQPHAGLLGAAVLMSCGHSQIAGTSLDDTPDNKAIIKVLASYKDAFERKDPAGILALVSPRFFETNGTADPSDDYDYAGLEKTLNDEFKIVTPPSLDLDLRHIEVHGDEAAANIFFNSRYQMADAGPTGGFKAASDVAQVRLRREDGKWKIISGI